MELLEGEETEIGKGVRTEEIERDMEEEIEVGEVRKAIKKLKVKKAAGVDGISMEAWKFAGSELVKELADLIKSIWVQGILPSDWRKSITVPLYKRGEKLWVIMKAFSCYIRYIRCTLKF